MKIVHRDLICEKNKNYARKNGKSLDLIFIYAIIDCIEHAHSDIQQSYLQKTITDVLISIRKN